MPGNHRRTCFNPRPHAAGDADAVAATESLKSFNPRPHAVGDAYNRPGGPSAAEQFQSTPARGGRPLGQINLVDRIAVSIHARTRRATTV